MLLFFVPGAKAFSNDLLEKHGLQFLKGKTHRTTFRGPRGEGMLIADASTPANLLEYSPDRQRWDERFGLDSLVGTDKDHPVTPESLQRETLISGPTIELLDGNRWTIPLLREWRLGDDSIEMDGKLPRVMQQSPTTGRFILGAVVPQYQQIWETSLEVANQILAQLMNSGESTLEDDAIHQFTIDLLAINYRLDASIVSHLRLLTPDLAGQILAHSLDLATLRAHLKNLLSRRMSGGTNTESGEQPQPEA